MPIKNPPTWPPIHRARRLMLAAGEVRDYWHKWFNAVDLWKITKGEGVNVAVLDTGIDEAHQCFKDGAIVKAIDCTGDRRFGYRDRNGHGTFCASVLGGRGDLQGVAPKCNLFVYKVLNNRGEGTGQDIARGIDQAVADGCHIVSMSLGSDFPDPQIQAAFKRAIAARRIMVAAAGNAGGIDTVGYPAAWAGHGAAGLDCIAVGAIDEFGQLAPFSSTGDQVDTVAPGARVLGAAVGGGYIRRDGTSMATPLVAGGLACAVAHHLKAGNHATPLETTAEAREHIKRSAKDAGQPGEDDEYGWGYFDPLTLVRNDIATPLEPAPVERQTITLPTPWGPVTIGMPALPTDKAQIDVGTIGFNW